MSMLHDNSSCYTQSKSKEKTWILLLQEILSSPSLRPGRNYDVVLCNDFRGNLLVLFRAICKFVKGPYGLKSCQISTA